MPRRASRRYAAVEMTARRSRRVARVGLGVLLTGMLATAGAVLGPVRGGTAEARKCNGRAKYCALRLDQIALPSTHNSSASRADGVRFPNQRHTMSRQLRDGIRGFQIDAFLGTVRRRAGHQAVFTDLNHLANSTLEGALGPQAVAAATIARKRIGRPPRNAHYDVYLCHNFCELGAVPMLDEAKHLARFLDRHPHEIVVWVIQDELPAARLLPVLKASGLDQQLATLDPHQPLPTLGEMIDADHRLVVGLENGDLGPKIPNLFASGLMQEVPYRFVRVDDLRAPASCRPLRGSPDAPLFQFNHWITPASFRASREVNAFSFLDGRARRCERERGRIPNLIAVDFYETGGLFRVTRSLNAAR
jgi:hypothetical protein